MLPSLALISFLSQELEPSCQGIMMRSVGRESGMGNLMSLSIYSFSPAISLPALEPLFHPPLLNFIPQYYFAYKLSSFHACI
jgi:hypothetical protein